MEPQSTLENDLETALNHLKQENLEKAGHQLKQISIKAYLSSKQSELKQEWLKFHRTTSTMGHAFLNKNQDAQQYVERHRLQVIETLESLLNTEKIENKKDSYIFNEQTHIAALEDRIEFLEKELEKSQEQVLELNDS